MRCRPAFPLQLAPSVYDENVFRGLDFVLSEARKRNIFVVLVLADWWCDTRLHLLSRR